VANEEHLAILRQGVNAWNQWREENPRIEPDLREASLYGADLRGADLSGADLSGAILSGANLREAWTSETVFVDVDLRGVQGLDTVQHNGPSSIGIDTLYHSQGDIPESFLRGCGVPDSMIEYARSLVVAQRPIV
jgi:uncharacterized protein YjbI with pentapeptide repeats